MSTTSTRQGTLNVFDSRQIASRMQARAKSLKINLPLSASLELVAAAFDYNNYHELSQLLKGIEGIDVWGVHVNKARIISIFEAYEKATGHKTVQIAVPVNDQAGEFSYGLVKVSGEAIVYMLECQLTGVSGCDTPDVYYPSYAWNTDLEFCFQENIDRSYFCTTGYHKHDDNGTVAVSKFISLESMFTSVLFNLAARFAPDQIEGLDAGKQSEVSTLLNASKIVFSGDQLDLIDLLLDSGDFEEIEDSDSLLYGDGHHIAPEVLFVMER